MGTTRITMKKIVLFTMCTVIAMSMTFISCSDDDDEGGSGVPDANVSVITTQDGEAVLVKSIGSNISFNYDDQGRCTYAKESSYTSFDISYDPYMIEYYDSDWLESSLVLSFNGSGYVSKYSCEFYDEDRYGSIKATETASFSYDSDGHITKISLSYNETEDFYGEIYTGSGSAEQTFTWQGGDMTKVVFSEKEKYDGETYEYKWTSTLDYSDTTNDCYQYVKATADEVTDGGSLAVLAYIGYFGKGTAHLPTAIETVEEEDGYTDTYSSTYSYTKNSNGTISTETVNRSTYTYTYTSVSSDTRSTAPVVEESSMQQDNSARQRRSTFRRLHSRRHNIQE